ECVGAPSGAQISDAEGDRADRSANRVCEIAKANREVKGPYYSKGDGNRRGSSGYSWCVGDCECGL
ncbi:MAG: hypothetical protein ACTSXF_12940, partial [Promethearchaeota archaeon]